MQKLLSLPPDVVANFHALTGYSRDEYFCASDPVGRRVGSGGGTVWLLEQACRAAGCEADFAAWLSKEKRILLHAGGQSRRLPAYAPAGKLLIPIPVLRWARGQRIDQNLLDLQMPLYERIMNQAPDALRTLIVSGDILVRTTEALPTVPDADVVCFGLWSSPEEMAAHGVFMMDLARPNALDFMLQKPSIEEQRRLRQTHYSLIDIGVWLLSDKAVERLRQKSKRNGETAYYDLYSDFGCALGTHPSKADADMADLSVAVLPLAGAEFYHFGTTPELLSSTMALQNLVKDQRLIIKKGIKAQPSLFTQNSQVGCKINEEKENIWIENSIISKDWTFEGENVVTGVPANAWAIHLRRGQCVDVVPVGEKAYALRPYGYADAFRGSLDEAEYLGVPFAQWMAERGLTADDFGAATDLQTAPIFPVTESIDELEQLLHWMLENVGGAKYLYRDCERLSAEQLMERANLERLFAGRERLQSANLEAMAANWRRSVFYQVNLKDVARKYAERALPLPAALPADAPLDTRFCDAMFRSDALQSRDPEQSKTFEKEAFSLLREGLMAKARSRRVQPRQTTLSDQIVWGRSAARIDLAGGWTDTPPYCLQKGGSVVNLAIEMNGQQPLQAYVKPCRERHIVCRSIDLGAMEVITTYDELRHFNKVGSPFSIPKAALALCGFLPEFGVEQFDTLARQLDAFGSGIEITLLSAIPAGSGLGTSSILAAVVLGALSDFCGLGWDKNEVCDRTLILEQLLTTGGGWQDQYGGVLRGLKLLQSEPGFEQNVVARWLPDTLFLAPEYRACHLLYYTGITRTAKGILAEIVRGMFLNETRRLNILNEMKAHAQSLFEAIQLGNFERFGRLIRTSWSQNKALDAGTNPPEVEALCRRIDDLCLGYKLPGAGGGGFMYMVAKDPDAALRLREELTQRPLTPTARFVELSFSHKGLQISRS